MTKPPKYMDRLIAYRMVVVKQAIALMTEHKTVADVRRFVVRAFFGKPMKSWDDKQIEASFDVFVQRGFSKRRQRGSAAFMTPCRRKVKSRKAT